MHSDPTAVVVIELVILSAAVVLLAVLTWRGARAWWRRVRR